AGLGARGAGRALLLPPASDALPSRSARDRGVTPPETFSPPQGDATTLLQLLGTTMRHYRQQQGLTHKALAVKTGLDKSYIGEIERGERNLSVLNVVRIAEALGLSVSQLLAPLDSFQSPSPPLPESSHGHDKYYIEPRSPCEPSNGVVACQ